MPVATPDDTAPEGYTIVHGYYRFTDIFYEWYGLQKSLDLLFESRLNERIGRSRAIPECNLQEVRNLKAFIAYDSIVDPEHPLAVEDGGLRLYLGTTPPLHLYRSPGPKIFQVLFPTERRG